MRSIRRTLVSNSLVLVGVTLLAICGVVYSVTARTLRAKEEATTRLVRERYEERSEYIHSVRDHDMLTQARTLAGLVQLQNREDVVGRHRLYPYGALVAALSPNAHVQIPIWAFGGVYDSPLRRDLYRAWFSSRFSLQLSEDYLPLDENSPRREFYQVTSEWGRVWRSRSLGDHSLPPDPPELVQGPFLDWEFDECVLDGDLAVRRVILKAPLSRYAAIGPPRGRQGSRYPPDPPVIFGARTRTTPAEESESHDQITESVLQTIYIQCAWEEAPFRKQIANLQARRDQEIASLQNETDQTLAHVRTWLVLIGLVSVPAVVLGGSVLVRAGLRPIRHVSVAVSAVSAKDFQLRIDPRQLPSELKPIVDRITQTLLMLQQAFDREKQATADISHELRTPLAALRTTIDVTLRKDRTPEQYRECLEDCRTIARQLSGLVERILMLARLDAGTDRLRLEQVELTDVLNECVTVARPLAEAKGLAFRYHQNGLLPVSTDPDKLREIVLNLLHNAVEYTPEGGSVELTGSRIEGAVRVEVKDTGVGIPEHARGHIFERFYRADPARHETVIHAGLGLAIVKEYVGRLGGKIRFDTKEGAGTVFVVELPNPSALSDSRVEPTPLSNELGRVGVGEGS